jgi:tetratricopeptide (TPR) repeat protein
VEDQPGALPQAVRVFVSYAHDDATHVERVREFWWFLRAHGVDARLDQLAGERRQDWADWMTREVRDAAYVLVIASPEYKRRAEGDAGPAEGRGVQWEARQIRDRFYADQPAGLHEVLPVVLPGCSAADVPAWLAPAAATYYPVDEFTVTGAESLLRVLTSQPGETEPPLGAVPVLLPRGVPQPGGLARPALRTAVVIEASAAGEGRLGWTVWVAGSRLCQQSRPVPDAVTRAWTSLGLPPLPAGERLAEAGRLLGATMVDEPGGHLLAELLHRLPPGDHIDIVLSATGEALSLPVELARFTTEAGVEVGPLALLPGVSVTRRVAVLGQDGPPGDAGTAGTGLGGPLKVLAAVAAPDETKTPNPPLDAEAEMQAVLDAVTGLTGHSGAQVRILEVASLAEIRRALAQDAYHVLHLSAHGSPASVELEDEDGGPAEVSPEALMQALRHAGWPVPLIVLSSCSGGATGSQAMAAGLLTQGADRVLAMLAPVTDSYATTLARHFYRELAAHPLISPEHALARARYLAEEDRQADVGKRVPKPEYGLATLLTGTWGGPLVDPAVPDQPLSAPTIAPSGKTVRELPLGTLIGRRAQLRTAMRVLRRAPGAVEEFGAASGVQLTGIGGIGKTALAGRIMARLREDGWLIVVHEGRWSPTALIAATRHALSTALPASVPGTSATTTLHETLAVLADPGLDDPVKLNAIAGLLATYRLLLVFDDFEQNLTDGGQEFLDPAIDDVLASLADAASTGALLVTCRYPLPGPDRFLVEIPVPALSAAELRRMFLRLPALRDLGPDDRGLLTRAIGGHPRLIEFTDALLRGGHANLRDVQTKLRNLARDQGIDLIQQRSLQQAADQAMVLGSADILLTELLRLLTDRQAPIVLQVAVSRAPMTLGDLGFALTAGPPPTSGQLDLTALRADVDRLAGLTLLAASDQVVMHPWTAELVTRNTAASLQPQHQRALAMRLRRFEQGRGSYDDLVDVARHQAALGRYDDLASLAVQAVRSLPGTLASIAYLAEVRPLIPPAQRAWMIVAHQEVQAFLNAGDLPAATRQQQAIHQQVQARANTDPTNTQWQRDLSVSHNKLGDLATAAGDLTTARTAYQADLAIAERLAAADPTNTQWQRDLSVSHNKLGDLARAAGDLTTARTAYQAALAIRERLAAADPTNTEWQRDLSVSHERLGDLATAAGDLTTARTAYQADLAIAERLAAADPTNTEWQRDLSVSHERLGDLATAAGDLTTARTAYQADLAIAERLAAADPTNTQWQKDLHVAQQRITDLA